MDLMHPSFHSRKQLAWGTLLFLTGFFSSLLAGAIGFIGWQYCKCTDEQRPTFVAVLCGIILLIPVHVMLTRNLEEIGPAKIKDWIKPLENKPFLPFLTIGLWAFFIVILTNPLESWFRCAFVLLIYMPVCFGFIVKTIPNIPDENFKKRRHPVEDSDEYRSMKNTIDALPDWLFAKDMLEKSLHVRLSDGTINCIVDADHPVPATIRKSYFLDSLKQQARLELYWIENYSRTPIAEYLISNIPKNGTNEKLKIELTFKIDSNKQLTCDVARPLKLERKSSGSSS